MKLRLPAFFMVAATFLFWGIYDRYESAGPVFLQNPSLTDAAYTRGDCTETNGHFVLNVVPAGKKASVRFLLPDAPKYDCVQVHFRMKLDGVVTGEHSWNCARFVLSQIDHDNNWIPCRHSIAMESGTMAWHTYDDVLELDAKTARALVVIEQTGSVGSAEFDQLIAEPVRLRTSFTWWRLLFAGLWLFMGVLYIQRCRLHSRKLRVLILLNAVAIILGVLMPEAWIEDITAYAKREAVKAIEISSSFKPSSSTSTDNVIETTDAVEKPETVQKKEAVATRSPAEDLINQFRERVGCVHSVGHFALFSSLCFLVYLSAALERQHPIYFLKVIFDVMFFAAATESLQYLTMDRAPGISDWKTDVSGMGAALALFIVVLPTIRLVEKRLKAKA